MLVDIRRGMFVAYIGLSVALVLVMGDVDMMLGILLVARPVWSWIASVAIARLVRIFVAVRIATVEIGSGRSTWEIVAMAHEQFKLKMEMEQGYWAGRPYPGRLALSTSVLSYSNNKII